MQCCRAVLRAVGQWEQGSVGTAGLPCKSQTAPAGPAVQRALAAAGSCRTPPCRPCQPLGDSMPCLPQAKAGATDGSPGVRDRKVTVSGEDVV